MLIVVCFFFEMDIAVGFKPISIFEIENQPFYSIDNEERKIQPSSLLARMDEFMI